MKRLLNGKIVLLLLFVVLGCASCMNGGDSEWVGQWQLREYQYPNGTTQKVDSIFYGFQKGSFLAYCMNEKGGYEGFYGYYKEASDEITITLWPDEGEEHDALVASYSYKKFFNWGETGERTFKVEELTSEKMRLNYQGTKYIFRKY